MSSQPAYTALETLVVTYDDTTGDATATEADYNTVREAIVDHAHIALMELCSYRSFWPLLAGWGR